MQSCEKLGLEGRSRLPALKGGRGACQKSQDQTRKRDQIIKLESTSKTNQKRVSQHLGNTLRCWDKPRALGHTRLTTSRTWGKPPPSPISYTLQLSAEATSKWLFFLGLPRRSPETISSWSPGTLGPHISRLPTPIGARYELKLQLSTRAFQRHVALPARTSGRGRFPTFKGPSFAHNLGCRCPNGQCEAILDIYTSRPFQ